MTSKRTTKRLQPYARILSSPGIYLMRMLTFIVLITFLVAVLASQFLSAFQANPGLNGLIVIVLLWGVGYSFWQVLRLKPEIRWVNAFRIADPGLAIAHQPVLLAPMATMLSDRIGALSLSTVSMRSIMDSIGSRLDDARDTGRYTIGLLVFLGLLGTFWGLLDTIHSFANTINALETTSDNSSKVFQELKIGLTEPLRGMGTAFASSLFGLSGSLVVGFLELQANHAHNRFYNELEEWLSCITELSPASGSNPDKLTHNIYSVVFETQRSLMDLSNRLQAEVEPGTIDNSVKTLINGVDQLIKEIRHQQELISKLVDDQSIRQNEAIAAMRDLISQSSRR
ncbi:MAG: hypothetical protein TECD_00897 [Hyphomicrobiaceae bacterium hypho_1]